MRHRLAVLCTLVLVVAAVAPAGVAGAAGAEATNATQPDCSFPVSTTDATGTEVTVAERPERVTTLLPSAAQTMWEIGGREQVVGVTRFASYLDGAESRTVVSGAEGGVSVEAVIGTEPDLVLAPNGTTSGTVGALRDAGLTVYVFPLQGSIADVRETTTATGRLTGNCEGAARANAWMTANVDAARAATADREPPRVLYPLGGGFVANTNTFISEMITVSGGVNVVGETNVSTAYPQLNDELILELDPGVVVVTGSNEYLLAEEPYASTAAVRNNRTVRVDVNYLNQPAPRSVVYSVRNLTTGFHPDADPEFVDREDVAVATETPPPTDATFTTTPTATATPAPVDDTPATTDGQPGFGALAALVALASAGLLARRR
jgi:iron complex transport system substrate-binding protein